MNKTINSIIYGFTSRKAWWFTATAKTKERFARTALGSFWLGLSNLLSILVLAFVYGTVFKVADFRSYVVYLGIGLVTWNTIAASIQASPNLLRNNSSNIKNTNIDPIFYTLEEWSFQFQTFVQSFGLVLLVLSLIKHSLLFNLITSGFIPFLNLLLLIYWLPVIICILGAKFEDFFQLIPILIQLMFLLSPILYRKDALGSIAWLVTINPIYVVLSNFRDAIITGETVLEKTLMIFFGNLIFSAISIYLLNKERHNLPFVI